MVDCIKRQNENYKGEPATRCINPKAEPYLQIVEPDQCAGCPMRKYMQASPSPCGKPQARLPRIEPGAGEHPSCPFRYESASGKLLCSITGLEATPEVCGRCDEETREHEAKFGEKVKNYFGAVRRWVANGKPSRSPEEIVKLFEENCDAGCERYDPERHACKNCGCTVSTDSSPLANKLAMATERCPLGRF